MTADTILAEAVALEIDRIAKPTTTASPLASSRIPI